MKRNYLRAFESWKNLRESRKHRHTAVGVAGGGTGKFKISQQVKVQLKQVEGSPPQKGEEKPRSPDQVSPGLGSLNVVVWSAVLL